MKRILHVIHMLTTLLPGKRRTGLPVLSGTESRPAMAATCNLRLNSTTITMNALAASRDSGVADTVVM